MPLLRSIFGVKSSRVLRVLLTEPSRAWPLRALAEEAEISLGMTSYVAALLIRMGLASRETSGKFFLTDPHRLIRQWGASHNYLLVNKFSEYYTFETKFEVLVSKFSRLRRRIKEKCALTLHAAAWLVAPYVRPADFQAYVDPTIDKKEFAELVRVMQISPSQKSGNVKLVTPYDEGVFYSARLVNGARIVSPVQLYVDLFSYPGRGEEAAERLLEYIAQEWGAGVVRHK